MALNIDVGSTIPSSYLIEQPISTHHVVENRHVVKQPSIVRDTFTYGGTRVMTFHIASNHHFLHPESRLAFDFRYTGTDDPQRPKQIEVGGVHSLFKSIRVILRGNGLEIPILDEYGRMYALQSQMFQSNDEVANRGISYYDDLSSAASSDHMKIATEYAKFPGAYAARVARVVNDFYLEIGALPCMNANIKVGDVVTLLLDSANISTVATVLDNVSDRRFKITAGINDYGLSDGQSLTCEITAIMGPVHNNGGSLRTVICDGQIHHVEMCLEYSFLKHTIPLFLLRNGFELQVELNDPNRVFGSYCLISGGEAALDLNYEITNPEYYMVLSKPHRNIQEEYISALTSANGLVYYMPGIDHWRYVSSNQGNDTIQLNFGRRSVRKLYFIFQSSAMEQGTDVVAKQAFSLSHTFRSKLKKFQMEIGGQRYPHYEIDIENDPYAIEALNYLMEANRTNMFNENVKDPYNVRANYRSCWPTSAENVQYWGDGNFYSANESEFFCIGVNVSRDTDETGVLTGIDLQGVTATIRIERSDNVGEGESIPGNYPGRTAMHVFSCYDGYLSLMPDNAVFMA